MERTGQTDAKTARNRCLQAMLGADDRTRLALWRAAKRYNERCVVERSGLLENSALRSRAKLSLPTLAFFAAAVITITVSVTIRVKRR